MLRDHYAVLGLNPSATLPEIRKAYRALARQLHPDKAQDDPYAREKFMAVKEAYEVLTNPRRRAHYLEERWYQQSTGKKTYAGLVTPETILQRAIELNRHVRTLDVHRMDRAGLRQYIDDLLDSEAIEKLSSFRDLQTNDEIVIILLKSLEVLSVQQTRSILEKIKTIPFTTRVTEAIRKFEIHQNKTHRWEKSRIWLIILAVTLLCMLIFFVSR